MFVKVTVACNKSSETHSKSISYTDENELLTNIKIFEDECCDNFGWRKITTIVESVDEIDSITKAALEEVDIEVLG